MGYRTPRRRCRLDGPGEPLLCAARLAPMPPRMGQEAKLLYGAIGAVAMMLWGRARGLMGLGMEHGLTRLELARGREVLAQWPL